MSLLKLSRRGTALVAFCALLLAPAASFAAGAGGFEEIKWEALVPKGWDPAKDFKNLDLSKLQDGDPKAAEALQAMKAAWDLAPTEPSLNGKKIRLPGFVLPLDQSDSLKTFLLVPYFGACIHSPPPPANQIIQVVLDKAVKGFRSMDPVWVQGTMELFRTDSPWGSVGYRLKAVKVEAYKP